MISMALMLCGLMLVFPALESPPELDSKVIRTTSKKNTKSFVLPFGKLWVDPSVWSKSKDQNVPGAVLELAHHEGDAFLAVVTSPDFMTANDFIVAFVDGMTSGDSEVKDAKLSKRRSIRLNGTQLTDITITAMVSDQEFVYRGYLYTGRKGVCLVLTWTHVDLYSELSSEIEQVLDGFIVK